jgi:hypothetical protein
MQKEVTSLVHPINQAQRSRNAMLSSLANDFDVLPWESMRQVEKAHNKLMEDVAKFARPFNIIRTEMDCFLMDTVKKLAAERVAFRMDDSETRRLIEEFYAPYMASLAKARLAEPEGVKLDLQWLCPEPKPLHTLKAHRARYGAALPGNSYRVQVPRESVDGFVTSIGGLQAWPIGSVVIES